MRLVNFNKPSVVQVQGVSVTADSHNLFSVPLSLTFGAHIVTITAQSGAESVTQTYEVFQGQTLAYDLNGNMTSDGRQKYEWDAANRLVKVGTLNPGPSNPAKSSEFTYDGLWRRVRILEKKGVQIVADRRFIWDGEAIKEERASLNNPVKRFYDDGVQMVSGSQAGTYYYLTDHLGSIRSVLDGQGLSVASYDYDLWGKRAKLSGTFDADFGYTGYFEHEPSGLALAWFRGYSPSLARWLSRDPIEESDSFNLYEYVHNNPTSFVDFSGLATFCQNRKIGGSSPRGTWNPISHTFTYTTDHGGNVKHTYSWGNTSLVDGGWDHDRPEDIKAALAGQDSGIGKTRVSGTLDPYIEKAFDMLNAQCKRHANGGLTSNCKTEKSNLIDLARKLQAADRKQSARSPNNDGCH